MASTVPMMPILTHAFRALVLLAVLPPRPGAQGPDAGARPTFEQASASLERDLAESLAELSALREQVAAEQLPLGRRLSELESELSRVRQEYQEASRTLDRRTLDLVKLRDDRQALEAEATYLSSLLGEYVRNFEARLHIAEVARHEAVLAQAKLAPENTALGPEEVYRAQVALLSASLERLYEALGGTRYEGTAVDGEGLVKPGTFLVVGPAAIFRSADGQALGTAEQRLGSLEPAMIAFEDPEDRRAAEQLLSTSAGRFPLDPTLGNAHKVEASQESLWEHVQRGGPVMVPIFALAAAALLVGVYKWLRLALVRRPSQAQLQALLAAVARRDEAAARAATATMGGPAGRMLRIGVEHLGEPRELIEEVMYEDVLATRLRLQRWLPFVAITASSAPLLGLLGTVTGIMNTFTLMTVFGTGDVKTLSSGISEALITTEFGLYVAIPSLLLHAFLARKARGVIDHMEKAAIALVNQVAKTPVRPSAGAPDGEHPQRTSRHDPVGVATA